MAADSSSPALKEIFNTERLQHIATEMTAVHPGSTPRHF
jgi:3-methyladenine DNA glycosylase AlkC